MNTRTSKDQSVPPHLEHLVQTLSAAGRLDELARSIPGTQSIRAIVDSAHRRPAPGHTPAPAGGTGRTHINVLFVGQASAVTNAAAALANELGDRLLWHVDLSRVVSKYIGETEKNLAAIFDAAEVADVVLFFDEADALFGKRSEVKDSHDRYANIEVSYLLQRMKTFAGVAILATNHRAGLDNAFTRRFKYVVEL